MTHANACCISVASSSARNSTGKERDTESGNDYFGATYYASSMGRWMRQVAQASASIIPYPTEVCPIHRSSIAMSGRERL